VDSLARALDGGSLAVESVDGLSTIGGGSAPGSSLPTRLLALAHADLSASQLEARLRAADPPVIGRIEQGRVVLDLRTVAPEEDGVLLAVLRQASG
jgi:L-seryl-tRNA(Ser) seleniumtransferase